jgi:hypothetical protein
MTSLEEIAGYQGLVAVAEKHSNRATQGFSASDRLQRSQLVLACGGVQANGANARPGEKRQRSVEYDPMR